MNIKRIFLTTAAVMACIFAPAAYAQPIQETSSPNFNIVLLTPGHSVTVTYELDDVIWNDINAFHVSYIVTAGAGTLTVRIASATSVGEFSNIVYAATGLLGTTPSFGYAYTTDTISLSADVSDFGMGLLFTAIITGIGDPAFPVVMGMIVSLT